MLTPGALGATGQVLEGLAMVMLDTVQDGHSPSSCHAYPVLKHGLSGLKMSSNGTGCHLHGYSESTV